MIELRPNRKQKHNSSHLKASNSLPVNFQLNPKILATSQISMAYRQTPSRPFINNVDQIEDILVIPIHQNTIQGSPIFQHKLLAFGAEDLHQNFPPLEEVAEKEIESEARLDTVNTIFHTEENLTTETASENVVRQEGQGADFIDENMTQKASLRVLCQFIITTLILIASSAGYLLLIKQIPLEMFFPIFILLASIYIIFLVKTKGFSFDQGKIDLLLSTGNAMSLIVFAIGAHIKVLAINFPITPFCTPGILFLVGAGIRNCINKIEPGRALLAVYKAVIWLQIFLISLHIDGITMSWRHAFIPLYLVAMSLAFFGMLIIFATILGFITMVKDEGMTLENAAGSLWYILNAFYIIVWLSILAQVVNKLENETGELESSLKAGIIHSAMLFVYTFLLWRPLCRFQEVEIQSEESEDDSSTNKSTRPTFRVSRNMKDKLVMRSPTFFQYLKKTSKKNKQEQVTHRQNPVLESDIEKHTSSNHEKKENEGICAVCFDNVSNAVLMDCGHGGICYACALESWKKTDNCFMCRRKINKVLKIAHSKTGSEIKVLESIQKIPVIKNYNI